jgi:hypothetical protein
VLSLGTRHVFYSISSNAVANIFISLVGTSIRQGRGWTPSILSRHGHANHDIASQGGCF